MATCRCAGPALNGGRAKVSQRTRTRTRRCTCVSECARAHARVHPQIIVRTRAVRNGWESKRAFTHTTLQHAEEHAEAHECKSRNTKQMGGACVAHVHGRWRMKSCAGFSWVQGGNSCFLGCNVVTRADVCNGPCGGGVCVVVCVCGGCGCRCRCGGECVYGMGGRYVVCVCVWLCLCLCLCGCLFVFS